MLHKQPTILLKRAERLSPWTTVISRTLAIPGCELPQEFHSVAQADYVSILAVTDSGQVPLVGQFRPALERYTVELPGGLLDTAEPPNMAAARELVEETGFASIGSPLILGCLAPDTGRLENRLWCYFAHVSDARSAHWKAEAGVEPLLVDRHVLRGSILDGQFDHALHIAVIGLALMRGVFAWD